MALLFNGRNNRYYIDKEVSQKLTTEQLRAAKFNNQFLMSVFTKLVGNNGTDAEAAIGQDYITCILDNKLPRSDSETGIDSKNLGGKLSFLVRSLKNNPEAQKKFQNTFFYQLICMFRRGTTDYNEKESWMNYQPTAACPDKYKELKAFAIAMLCHSKDDTAPVGINFGTLIDSLVDTDRMGNYYIKTDFDNLGSTAQEMNSACKEYLKTIKANPSFKRFFDIEDGTALY